MKITFINKLPKKQQVLFVLFSILTLSILWFIFHMSAKPAIESSEDSRGLSYITAEILNYLLNTNLTANDTVGFVRTFAHFSEFSALSFCFSSSLKSLFGKEKKVAKISFPFILLVALTDETIQLFYDGRAFQIKDICIDTLGGLFGIVFLILILKIFFKKSSDKKQKRIKM